MYVVADNGCREKLPKKKLDIDVYGCRQELPKDVADTPVYHTIDNPSGGNVHYISIGFKQTVSERNTRE